MSEAGPTTEFAPEPAPTPSRRGVVVPAALFVAAAVLIAGGAVMLDAQRHRAHSASAAGNEALVDTGATSDVIGQVGTALNKILSYRYAQPDATQAAAAALLTGDAAGQYTTLFKALQAKAPGEKLTLTAQTVVVGVSSLKGSTAQLLVFLDQSSMRATDKQPTVSAAQIQITALKQGSTWKISELDPL